MKASFLLATLISIASATPVFASMNSGAPDPVPQMEGQWPTPAPGQATPFEDFRIGQLVTVDRGAAAYSYIPDCGSDGDRSLNYLFSVDSRTSARVEGVLRCGRNLWILVVLRGQHVIVISSHATPH